MQQPGPRELTMFVPYMIEAGAIRRIEGFLSQGCRLTVFGFRRDRLNAGFELPCEYIHLGRTEDGRYLRRLAALLAALPKLVRHRRHLRAATIYYARNIDLLLLALAARAISGGDARIVYEVLDIQPAFVGPGRLARVLRAVERWCLDRVSLLVLSSPGFLRHFYAPVQGWRKSWFLLENKLPNAPLSQAARGALPLQASPRDRQGYRWVVGYNGCIRGNNMLELIVRLAERLTGEVLFKFRGIFTTIDRARFDAISARHPNIVYEGEYVMPDDLGRIHADLDFAWALDLENVSDNSRWLLPCRFYEAGFFGVPCLAARGFEVGALVDRLGVGWTFEEPLLDSIEHFLRRVSEAEVAQKRRRLLDLPIGQFVQGEDVAALCDLMEAQRPKLDRRASLGVATS